MSTGDPIFELRDWDELPDWQPQTVKRLRKRAVREFQEGRYNKDFSAKLVERNISEPAILSTLRNRRTIMVLYRDDYDRTQRIGFWHPGIRLFVAWKPGRRSEFKTCFYKRNGIAYMQQQPESRPIHRPER